MTTIQQVIFLDGGPGQIDYWFNQLTNTNDNDYSLSDHAFDSLGNIIVAGTSIGTWPDNKHFWHKIGKNGDILVTRSFNDSNSGSDVTDIAIDSSDNIYAAIGNARFVKWDSSYNIVYSKRNTWSSNQPYGDSGVGGGSLTLSANALTYYSIGSNRRAMQVDASTGETTSATTASAGNTIFGVGGFGKTSQGNFLCGYVQSPSTNNDNYWMVATTSLSQQFCFYSGSTAAICRGIDYINGNYYIVGMRQTDNSFAGDALMYKLGSYSSSGNQGILWSRRIRNINNTSNGSYQSQFYDVAGDSEGNIYTVGHSPEPSTAQGGIIMKFDSGGTVVWARFIKHSSGSTYVTKITIDSNDTMWINIHVGGNVCGVAKLPTTGLFTGTYCGFTVTDWSSGFNSSYQSFNHNAQSGAVPTFFSGGSSLTMGSPVTVSYTEPTVPGSSGQCKSMLPTNGQAEFTTPGTYTWVAPPDVTSVSVVAIGGGGGGSASTSGSSDVSWGAGGGGGLGWKNNISVTPGQSYTVVVGAGGTGAPSSPQTTPEGQGGAGGDSYFISDTTVKGGGGTGDWGVGGNFVGDNQNVGNSSQYNGRNGGYGSQSIGAGGAGAAGYSGIGAGDGRGGTSASGGGSGSGNVGGQSPAGDPYTYGPSGGGGTGIYGEGATGFNGNNNTPGGTTGGGQGGSGGEDGVDGKTQGADGFPNVGDPNRKGQDGGKYGGGGGYGMWSSIHNFSFGGGDGGGGAVRIIWPGTTRQFPTTGTEKL